MPGAMTGLRIFAVPFSKRLDDQGPLPETNMPGGSHYRSLDEGVSLNAMADKLMADPGNTELAQRYFTAANDAGRIQHAEKTFESILIRFPNLHPIRRLNIACCLKQEKYESAMDAIEILVTFSKPDDQLLDTALQVRNLIGSKVISREKKDTASLALCMVVKNEQSFLAPCLNAVKSIADEIILIDTGSVDRTADLARIFGAQVYDYKWDNDFSAARNFGLEKASAQWILILDADETIASEDRLRLQNLVVEHQDRPVAFSIETRNYTRVANTVNLRANTGEYPRHETGLGWFPSRKIRLFPNSAHIRFQFPVHELVDPSVKRAGLKVIDSNIPVHHYGCLNESRTKEKAVAYFRMGYSKLDRLGNDAAALRELAVQAGQLEYWPEALELWQRLLTLRPDYAEAYVNMAAAYWQIGKYGQSLESAQKACGLAPHMKEAAYNLAVSWLMLGNAERATVVLTELLDTHSDYLAARFMLAAAAGCAGDMDRCVKNYRKMKKMQVGEALGAGIADLQQRLRGGGLARYADALDLARRRLEI